VFVGVVSPKIHEFHIDRASGTIQSNSKLRDMRVILVVPLSLIQHHVQAERGKSLVVRPFRSTCSIAALHIHDVQDTSSESWRTDDIAT